MKAFAACLLVLLLVACGADSPTDPSPPSGTPGNTDTRALREVAAASGKLVGTAVQAGLFSDSRYRETVARDFSYLTAEYEMKWASLESVRGAHNFSRGDAILAAADAQGARVKGHALLWHQSTPGWAEGLSADDLRTAVADHIRTTVEHYRGRIHAWDVVNEAIADSGGLRDTVYLQKLGDGYIAEAFRAARAADPGALLFYNDYGAEGAGTKSNRVYELVRSLREQGVPIDGVGLQMHISASNRPSDANIAANMRRLADLGLIVSISEMDVKTSGVAGSTSTRLEAQRATYHDVVRLCVLEPRCDSVTFWGFTDAHTWLPTESPLLYDTQFARKPAYFGVLDALAGR